MRSKKNISGYLSAFIILLLLMQALPLLAAEKENYCVQPPYVRRNISPNVLILMDNAEIMGEPAYCTKDTNYDTNKTCTDNYDYTKSYSGLFIENIMYTYGARTVYTGSGGNRWKPDNGADSDPNSDGQPGIVSGNLLNWATTSKYDLLESIIVGGKSASRQAANVNTLLSVSTTWTKTFTYTDSTGTARVCKFLVSGANVQITDTYAGSCGYLDSPPKPLVSDMRTSLNEHDGGQKAFAKSNNILQGFVRQSLGFLNDIMNFLTPDAEAGAQLRISTSSLPDGTECTAYTAMVSASGGTAPYSWSISAGSLPAGLSLGGSTTVTDAISGTVSATSGTYVFTILVTDSGGSSDTKQLRLKVNDATVAITTTSPLQGGYTTAYYWVPIETTGACIGTFGSYTISATGGSLPPQYVTNVTHIYHNDGWPASTPGTYTFTITSTDGYGNSASKQFSLTVTATPSGFHITSGSPLAGGTIGSPYFIYIESAGGTGGTSGIYSWSITSGSLPPGLSLTGGSGYFTSISGTPTTQGTYTFTITVTDSLGITTSTTFSLSIGTPAPTVRTTGNMGVQLCAGTYTTNCDNTPSCVSSDNPPCPSPCNPYYTDRCVLKSGIVDQMWVQARLGLEDFTTSAGDPTATAPSVTNCIETCSSLPVTDNSYCPTPAENFLTAVENAVPSSSITKLVDGEYRAIDYYANNTASNCDPFRSSPECQRNFILMITSGTGANNPSDPSGGSPQLWSDATHCASGAYASLTKNSCYGYFNDLRSTTEGKQNVSTYIVNTMGEQTTPVTGQPSDYCDPTATPLTKGDILCQAAMVGGGMYYQVVDPSTLKAALVQAFQDILKRAAAGTAASVLASGEGSGANLLQAVFYPATQTITRGGIFGSEIAWVGRLSNFWYYVDPFFNASSIYEDTVQPSGTNNTPGIFDLSDDDKVSFRYDIINERTMAKRVTPSGVESEVEFEKLNVLWEAGLKLWQRTTARTIKTTVGSGLIDFSTANAGTLYPYFALPTTINASTTYMYGDLNHDGAVDSTDAEILIRYVHGEDFSTLRPRTTGVDLNANGNTSDAGEEPKVWKLGDILNSTPKISSWIPVNNYDQVYKDTSYTAYLNTTSDTSTATGYKNRGVVFAGGNDGMLHAFKLGKLELSWSGQTSSQKAKLTGTGIGEELWAFIPKNTLPYLRYLTEGDYCHVYSIDLSPYIFDASIGASADSVKPSDGSSWRTILVGGMRYGGACKDSCADSDCVENPTPGVGYSSYFALDITNQTSPVLLWEFSNTDLGFSTTGPAIVREGDNTTNGKWFVIIGSGPTGPVNSAKREFLAHSDQILRLFILDLKTGTLLRTIDQTSGGTQLTNAYAGSMLNATSDVNLNYQDDIVYIPYVKKCTSSSSVCTVDTWTNGGVGRLQTKESTSPSNWTWSLVYDNIGTVTASVTRLINKTKGQLWLYFGTGRYYTIADDPSTQRSLFGIMDPCYTQAGLDADCTTAFSASPLDVTNTPNPDITTVTSATHQGWTILLDNAGSYTYPEGTPPISRTKDYNAERIVTDPLSTTSGLVFFTSYKPYNDACAYGGKSFIWAVRYNTGGAPGALLKGIALLQVSTGSIEQINLASAFTEAGGRKSYALEGVPPLQQGLSLLSTPPPVKRTIHIRER